MFGLVMVRTYCSQLLFNNNSMEKLLWHIANLKQNLK
nr:MAG TPA: hypothetical protein [Caudoviricetes sp.]DAR89856.1 MAG TPA: hypothetical protein [Caudoviricetes sp.]DAY39882.1 MAG TPA: hypothetical protein [Caudoviricetes sp.]